MWLRQFVVSISANIRMPLVCVDLPVLIVGWFLPILELRVYDRLAVSSHGPPVGGSE